MSTLAVDAVVYGGGPAALMAAHELAAAGLQVALVGPVRAAAWPVIPEGGLDDGSAPEASFRDTLRGGDFLAARAPVRAMCESAAATVAWLEELGVPFLRDPRADRQRERRRRQLEGTSEARGCFAEARTVAITASTLDRALTQHAERVTRLERHSLVALAKDNDGAVVGAVFEDEHRGELVAVACAAFVLASGGLEKTFAPSPAALATESALAVAMRAGAVLANLELVAPAIALSRDGGDTAPRRLLAGSLRGEGARVWMPMHADEARPGREVPSDERTYLTPSPRAEDARAVPPDHDLARAVPPDHELARAMLDAHARGHGVWDRSRQELRPLAYLDLCHFPEGHLRERLGTELDVIQRLTGVAPYREPVLVCPTLVGRLGGAWVDFAIDTSGSMQLDSPRTHATSVAGLYAAGGVCHAYHGAGRIGGNGLLADLFGGRAAARGVLAYRAARAPTHTGAAALASHAR